jgi:hypothetical protein
VLSLERVVRLMSGLNMLTPWAPPSVPSMVVHS